MHYFMAGTCIGILVSQFLPQAQGLVPMCIQQLRLQQRQPQQRRSPLVLSGRRPVSPGRKRFARPATSSDDVVANVEEEGPDAEDEEGESAAIREGEEEEEEEREGKRTRTVRRLALLQGVVEDRRDAVREVAKDIVGTKVPEVAKEVGERMPDVVKSVAKDVGELVPNIVKKQGKRRWNYAWNKIKDRPLEALSIPFTAAFVGWITNKIAVEMIFFPVEWRGIPIAVVSGRPFGILGWQGIVPAKAGTMSARIVDMVTTQLLNVDDVFRRLSPRRIARLLAPEIAEITSSIADSVVPNGNLLVDAAGKGLSLEALDTIRALRHQMIVGLTKDMQKGIQKYLDLKELVVGEMLADRRLLIELFQRCGKKEFSFLVNSGFYFGFILGIIQMGIWLLCDKAWTLPVGGAVVGYLTNWIALKLIFEPVNPRRIGPFVLQGLFLKRQFEVSAEFADFFATQILRSKKMWGTILAGSHAPQFYSLLEKHTKPFLRQAAMTVGTPIDDALVGSLSQKVAERLPDHIGVLHEYTDATLALQPTIRKAMEKMSPSDFESVLHPIFQEDELTLVLAGAVLGAAAGFVQMLFSTRSKDDLPKSPPKSPPSAPAGEEGTATDSHVSPRPSSITAAATAVRGLLRSARCFFSPIKAGAAFLSRTQRIAAVGIGLFRRLS